MYFFVKIVYFLIIEIPEYIWINQMKVIITNKIK